MKKKYYMLIGLAVLLILAAGSVFYIRKRPQKGVEVTPSSVYELPQVVYYRQNDSRWKDDHLGASRFQMGGSGCLTSCIASALSIQAGKGSGHSSCTPGELNQLFTDNGVYNESGDIMWNQIENALPGISVEVENSVSSGRIDQWLQQGIYPLAKVKNNGSGAIHWVLITGSKTDGYFCMDPLREGEEPVPLSVHGSKVYSLRAVYWNDAALN